ncbi:unnamed protein product [Porites lobata]|uniref:ShKT domain-containing protein n=1 Tax=Porites lobata TaxID=104759 RepID=A0ABN8QAD6_9CNID|nr:unnamed protein product [Porites lobata]
MMKSLVCLFLWFSTLQISTSKRGPISPQPGDFVTCRLSDDLKEKFLDLHNTLRGQVQPSAADMEYMEWNDDLGNLAQMWSDQCEWMHGFTKFGAWHPNIAFRSKTVGQNLAREWGKWIDNKNAGPEDSVRRWFNERDYYSFGKFAYPMPQSMCTRKPCGHYTQVVWASSKKLGCAFKWCDKYFGTPHPWVPGETVVTCDYYPSGNVVGQFPYTPGPPCSKCASGKGWCYKNLCRECKDFSPKCGGTYTKGMCLSHKDLMEKHCPRMCNMCKCQLQCKNGGQIDRKTCTCTCYGKWKGSDCTEKICDQGWYGKNCEKKCMDKVETSTCKWRVQNGHACSLGYMKYECFKTCVCDLMPTPQPKTRPTVVTQPTPTTPPALTHPIPTKSPPTTECKDTCSLHCEFWAGLGECKKHADWMRSKCMKSCGVCTCQDVYNTAQCRGWAATGECSKNSLWMEVNCPKSCLVCDCHDQNIKCGGWVKSGLCDSGKYITWMNKNCKKSCKKC